MSTELDIFDAALEAQETPQERKTVRSNIAIKDMIVNPDVASQLIKGYSIVELALRLGVSPLTIRKWMNRSEMKDLLAIEARRIMRTMSRRKLSEVKYKDLAASASILLDQEAKQRNGQLDQGSGIINQTTIDQINILVLGQGNRGQSEKNISGNSELGAGEIPELPEEFDEEGTREIASSPGSGDKP